MNYAKEEFISVDVETSGPSPRDYALLSIGACTVFEPRKTFYIELKPDAPGFTPEAMDISKLSLDRLRETGSPPEEAMRKFADWVKEIVPEGSMPVFTAFNAPFDWMFVDDYFYRYLGYNPFGHKALDIKALYMGVRKTNWAETSYNVIMKRIGLDSTLTHHALDDAIQQAKLFKLLLDEL